MVLTFWDFCKESIYDNGFFTALFIIIPSLKNVILPIVFPGNTTILTTNAAVGLTHHYSANGNFMALALGASVWLYDSKEYNGSLVKTAPEEIIVNTF